MRWPFGRNRPMASDTPSAATSPAPAEPVARWRPAEWAALPPISRTVGEPPLTAPARPFHESLHGGPRPPLALAQLGHDWTPDAPRGVVLATSYEPVAYGSSKSLPVGPAAGGGAASAAGQSRQVAPAAQRRSVLQRVTAGQVSDERADAAPSFAPVSDSGPAAALELPNVAPRELTPLPDVAPAQPARRLTQVEPDDLPAPSRAADAPAHAVDGDALSREATPPTPPPTASTEPPVSGPGPAPRLTLGQARRLGLGQPIKPAVEAGEPSAAVQRSQADLPLPAPRSGVPSSSAAASAPNASPVAITARHATDPAAADVAALQRSTATRSTLGAPLHRVAAANEPSAAGAPRGGPAPGLPVMPPTPGVRGAEPLTWAGPEGAPSPRPAMQRSAQAGTATPDAQASAQRGDEAPMEAAPERPAVVAQEGPAPSQTVAAPAVAVSEVVPLLSSWRTSAVTGDAASRHTPMPSRAVGESPGAPLARPIAGGRRASGRDVASSPERAGVAVQRTQARVGPQAPVAGSAHTPPPSALPAGQPMSAPPGESPGSVRAGVPGSAHVPTRGAPPPAPLVLASHAREESPWPGSGLAATTDWAVQRQAGATPTWSAEELASAADGSAAPAADRDGTMDSPPAVQRVDATPADASAGAAATGTPSAPGEAGKDLEELAGKLYDRIRSRLRGELLADRERAGLLVDL